jgi:hypothetical protein
MGKYSIFLGSIEFQEEIHDAAVEWLGRDYPIMASIGYFHTNGWQSQQEPFDAKGFDKELFKLVNSFRSQDIGSDGMVMFLEPDSDLDCSHRYLIDNCKITPQYSNVEWFDIHVEG